MKETKVKDTSFKILKIWKTYNRENNMNECIKGHKQPKDHDNNCNYCVAVFGLRIPDKYKTKRRNHAK